MPEAAGITVMKFNPAQADQVIDNIKQQIIPVHKNLKNEGLKRAVFVVNRETGEAIGIALWNDRNKLKQVEGKRGPEAPDELKNPNKAPTDYTKKRAREVQNVGGNITSTDWYEIVGEV